MHAKFASGSVARHLIRVTLTNSISLLSLYVVDILALYWLSRAQDGHVLAAVGLVGTLQFLVISICLGLSTAMMTMISRNIGAANAVAARTVASSALASMFCLIILVALILAVFSDVALLALGAQGRVLELATGYLQALAPAFVVMALGQVCVYILLAHGQNNRAMIVVLSGTVAVALLDPVLIIEFGWGLSGAAMSYAIARTIALSTGIYFVVKLRLISVAKIKEFLPELRGVISLALPTVVSNLAPGVAAAYVISQMATFGPEVLAGATVIDRILQFSFGAFFALPGAIAPVLGQNLGAGLHERVLATIRCAALLVVGFGTCVSTALYLFSGPITSTFHLEPAGRELVMVFCVVGGLAWTLIGLQFVALPTFNVMRKPAFSAIANWSRATVGAIPFVLVGGAYWGAQGVLVGQLLGNAIVAIAAFALCLLFVRRRICATDKPQLPSTNGN